jgi:translation initiation factor 1
MLICSRVAVVFAVQSWLAESAEQRATSSTPGYFSVGMACKFRFKN